MPKRTQRSAAAMAISPCKKYLCRLVLRRELRTKWVSDFSSCHRDLHTRTSDSPAFGLLFDIDGVIVRGKKVLPFATQAFQKLIGPDNKFRVPAVFVTNAGNMMRHQKAEQLSNWLGVEVSEEQVVMAHSPLRMFKQFHDKHVIVSGQGPSLEIAKCLGFNKVVTMEEFRNAFPKLDAVDHARRLSVPCAFERYFPRIEAVVLFGEPVRWETSLQMIIDILMTNGLPYEAPKTIPYPHIPVLACNMDLQWMAEACMPRFGHGAFLVCLENLFKKITGHELVYSALVGKPSEITYHYAQHTVVNIAKKMSLEKPIKRLYAIGDNINTDIYGANLYHRFLRRRLEFRQKAKLKNVVQQQGGRVDLIISSALGSDTEEITVENCESILVQTGVYNKEFQETSEHSPRDFLPVEEKLKEPSYVTENVNHAIELVFEREGFW